MAPKKSKVKKRVAQPAKGIIERTICAHPMLKRVQKEVRELKRNRRKSRKNNYVSNSFNVFFYTVRSKYCFRPEDLSSAVFWFDNVYIRAIPEHPEDLFTLYVMRVQKRKWRTFGVFYLFITKKF